MTRRGFTFIEMLLVFVIVGILAGIAILKYIDLKNEARAAKVASELNAIRLGAYSYYHDAEGWPPEQGAGVVPPQLTNYLPTGFKFDPPDYTLDWDHLPGSGGGNVTIAVTVSSADTKLMNKLGARLSHGSPYTYHGGILTYFIVANSTTF